MKKELALHFISTLILVILIVLFKAWFNLSYWPLLVGAIIGTFLPDIDHLVYVYLLMPQDLTSQRVNHLVTQRDIGRSVSLLYETRGERKNLIFHSAFFQAIFWILTFLVVSSSGSVFGRGIVTAFSLHLILDQVMDFRELGSLDNWLTQIKISLPRERTTAYLVVNFILLGLFALIF